MTPASTFGSIFWKSNTVLRVTGVSIVVGATSGCLTTCMILELSFVSIVMMPSATLIMATRSSALPQPSSMRATTELPSAPNLDRNSLMNLTTWPPSK